MRSLAALFFLMLLAMALSGCASMAQSYIEVADARQWQGCHCVKLMASGGFGASGSASVSSMLATGGATIEQCRETVTCP